LFVFAVKGLVELREYVVLILVFFVIFVSFFVSILFPITFVPEAFFRAVIFVEPLLLLGLVYYYKSASLWMKRCLLVCSLVFFAYNFLFFGLNLLGSISVLC
jgi:hypothetical protein